MNFASVSLMIFSERCVVTLFIMISILYHHTAQPYQHTQCVDCGGWSFCTTKHLGTHWFQEDS